MQIRVLLESQDKVYDGEQLDVNEQSSQEEIIKAVAGSVLEDTGVNIEESGNYVVAIRESTSDPKVKTAYLSLKPTAGK